MARQNRRDIFDANEVTVLHCCQRAVRRAWLCGIDPLTGLSFEHRKVWIQNRLQELARIFGVDCLSFSVMSNHLHVILRNRPDVVKTWSDDEVARRWWLLFPKRRNEDGTAAEPKDFEMKAYAAKAKVYRVRLADISWWMRALAEPIARAANLEDDCRGRFWQGRFSSQKLTDEMAILACSAYVDLNPVRSGVAATPESSQYTSAYERIESDREEQAAAKPTSQSGKKRMNRAARRRAERVERKEERRRRDAWLSPITIDERASSYTRAMPSQNGCRASDKGFLAMTLQSYLQLLDWTGRQLRRDGKRGRIPIELEPILQRIGMSSELWCEVVSRFGKIFQRAAGRPSSLAEAATARGQRWYQAHSSPVPDAS